MSLPNISIEKQLHYAQGGEQGGVNIREASTALLGISSGDRYNRILGGQFAGQTILGSESNPVVYDPLSSPYDFTLTTPAQNLLTGFFTRLAVNEVQFKWSIPTITSRNNKIWINVAPNGNYAVTGIAITSTSAITLTMATTTGFVAGQSLIFGSPTSSLITATYTSGGVTQVVNLADVYTLSSVTSTTLVMNNPRAVPTSATLSQTTGQVFATALITMPEGWYDLYNQDTSSNSKGGNLAYQFQTLVRSATSGSQSIASLLNLYTCVYNLPWQGGTNPGTTIGITGQPYNCFFSSNLSSSGASPVWFNRYTEPTRPNAIGLYEQMGWNNQQSVTTFQYGSPTATLLSTPFVDIVCDGLTYNQSLKDGDSGDISRTMLCRIFLTPDAFTGNTANLGSAPILIHRAFPFPKQIKWNANQPIGNLKFQVYDSQGYLLSTYDGVQGAVTNPPSYFDSDMADWHMTLLVSEV
jgi:hypothetical protein